MTSGNLTVTRRTALRRTSTATTPASSIAANRRFPNLVPGLNYNGSPVEFTWKTFQPRRGRQLRPRRQERKTLLRASYSRYADQLGGSIVTWDNPPAAAASAASQYVWTDRNGNHNVDPGELGAFVQDLGGFNHNDPNALWLRQQSSTRT